MPIFKRTTYIASLHTWIQYWDEGYSVWDPQGVQWNPKIMKMHEHRQTDWQTDRIFKDLQSCKDGPAPRIYFWTTLLLQDYYQEDAFPVYFHWMAFSSSTGKSEQSQRPFWCRRGVPFFFQHFLIFPAHSSSIYILILTFPLCQGQGQWSYYSWPAVMDSCQIGFHIFQWKTMLVCW